MLRKILLEALDAEDEETKIILKYIYSTFKFQEAIESKSTVVNIIEKLIITDEILESGIIYFLIKLLGTNSCHFELFMQNLKIAVSEVDFSELHLNGFYNIYNFFISIPNIDINVKLVVIDDDILNIKLGKIYFI